jgi:hypothetical protein
LFPVGVHERAGAYEQRASPALYGRCKGGLDVAVALHIEDNKFLTHCLRRNLYISALGFGVRSAGIDEHGNPACIGHELAQQVQSLRSYLVGEKADAGDVASRPIEAGDETLPDRVGPGDEDDRHQCCCGLSCKRGIVVADNDGRLDQVGDQRRQSLQVIFRRAIFDCNILAFDEAGFFEALPERSYQICNIGKRCAAQESDHQHWRLLRPRRERPHHGAAEQRDELSPPHSITSSAVASNVGGMVNPSALAVLRLMTSSNFVGACTGRLAGFSPLRIRSI